MRSSAYGLGWHLWRRHRLGFSVILAYLFIEIIAAQAVPLSLWSRESAAVSAAIPLTMIAMYLMAVFVNSDADFANTTSGYPSYLFTLPVRTRELALWPMAFGTVSVSLLWIAVASLVFVPRGIHSPVWWPVAMLSSTVACLQTIMWRPMPLPYIRAVLAVVLLPSMIFLGTAAYQSGVSEPLLAFIYMSVLPFAIVGAVDGVNRARQGQNAEWSCLPERRPEMSAPAARGARSFGSRHRAQFWMEWKRNGVMLPLLVATACALFLSPLLFVHETGPLRLVPPGARTIEANVCLNILMAAVLLPVWFAMVLGSGGRKSDTRGKDLTIHPFIATRPISSLELVQTKTKVAAMSALAAWAVMLIFIGIGLVLPAREGDIQTPLGVLLLGHLTAKQALITVLALLSLVAFTWKCQVDSLWIDLSGNKWLAQGYPLFFGAAVTVTLTLGASSIGNPDFGEKLVKWLLTAAWAFALIKVLARGWVARALVVNRIISARSALLIVTGWLASALILFVLLTAFVPSEMVAPKYLALGVFLALPFARVGAAPLALELNRHR